jgi:hypothetical protein
MLKLQPPTPELVQMQSNSNAPYYTQMFSSAEPKGFNFDVIMPSQSELKESPLKGGEVNNEFSTDSEKDQDSTDYSHGDS